MDDRSRGDAVRGILAPLAAVAAAAPIAGIRPRLTVRPRALLASAAVAAILVSLPAPALALDARVMHLRMVGGRIRAAIDVRDLLRDNFLALVRQGRAIFVQVEADLWEDRRIFDRMIVSITPGTWRVDGDGPGVVVSDDDGESFRQRDLRQPLSLQVDLGPASRLDDQAMYYVHAVVTAATVDERDVERAGEALFGDDRAGRGAAGVGRLVFRTLLRMGKYFESASAEVTSRRASGSDIRRGAF